MNYYFCKHNSLIKFMYSYITKHITTIILRLCLIFKYSQWKPNFLMLAKIFRYSCKEHIINRNRQQFMNLGQWSLTVKWYSEHPLKHFFLLIFTDEITVPEFSLSKNRLFIFLMLICQLKRLHTHTRDAASYKKVGRKEMPDTAALSVYLFFLCLGGGKEKLFSSFFIAFGVLKMEMTYDE